MKLTDRPTSIPVPWASGAGLGYTNPIPPTSQIGINDGYASWIDGFPPLTFQDPATGGVPPRGQDFQGVLKEISGGLRWLQAGGFPIYNNTFASAIGGYPAGAVIASATYQGLLWRSIIDDNMDDPDDFGARWQPYNRLRLISNQTLWVDQATGSDSNSGLTEGDPLATIGRVIHVINSFIDPAGWQLGVQIKPGNYTNDPIKLINTNSNGEAAIGVSFEANHGAVNIVITDPAILGAIWADGGAIFSVSGNDFHLSVNTSAASSASVLALGGARININGNITYNASSHSNLLAANGARILYGSPCTDQITGDTPRHWEVGVGAQIDGHSNASVQFVGTRNFSTAFAVVSGGNLNIPSLSATGTATGKRFDVTGNGTISGVSGDPNAYIPGSVDGTTSSGGQVFDF